MIKQVLLVVLIGLSVADKRENLQQAYNGIFKANNLQAPTDALKCFNSTEVDDAFDFATNYIQSATTTPDTNLADLSKMVFEYLAYIEENTGDCLTEQKEFQQLATAYSTTAPRAMAKVAFYNRYNWVEVKGTYGDVNTLWQSGQFESAGLALGNYMHLVLP